MFPKKEIHLTECTSGNWSPSFDGSFEWAMKNLIFGHFNAGAQSLIYWNLVLDANNGPQNGGCKDCRGIFNLNKEFDEFKRSPEYYALNQASSVIYPNSLRIKSTSDQIEHQMAFKNPDLSLSWIGMNNKDSELKLLIKSKQGCLSTKIKPKSVLSINWP
jgi:glucosylceramidase